MVVAVALLLAAFGSVVVVATVAVLERTVAAATEAPTFTTSVNTALPGAKLALVHEMLPLAPTAGVVHDQPPAEASETKVVPAGRLSASDAAAALLGPALATVMV